MITERSLSLSLSALIKAAAAAEIGKPHPPDIIRSIYAHIDNYYL